MKRTYKTTLVRSESANYVPVPFDPKAVFGKVRAPVNVTLNGYTYRSTIALMGGCMGFRCARATAKRPSSMATRRSRSRSSSTSRRASPYRREIW